jgi:hypothetical protein
MWKNMLDPDRLLMENNTTQKRHDIRAGYLDKKYRYTFLIFNTY